MICVYIVTHSPMLCNINTLLIKSRAHDIGVYVTQISGFWKKNTEFKTVQIYRPVAARVIVVDAGEESVASNLSTDSSYTDTSYTKLHSQAHDMGEIFDDI